MDIEKASREIDDFITRRAEQNAAELEREVAWAESVRGYHARRRRENAAAWCAFHREQAERIERTAAALAWAHREKAEKLLEDREKETT